MLTHGDEATSGTSVSLPGRGRESSPSDRYMYYYAFPCIKFYFFWFIMVYLVCRCMNSFDCGTHLVLRSSSLMQSEENKERQGSFGARIQ